MSNTSRKGPGLYRGYSATERQRINRKKGSQRRIFAFLVFGAIVWGGWLATRNLPAGGSTETVLSVSSSPSPTTATTKLASVASPTPTPTAAPIATPISAEALTGALQRQVSAHPELIVGISFVDIGSGTQANIGGDTSFTAASTAKVLVACAFLKQVEDGKASLDQSLGNKTAQWQLQQMINQSNNTSWALFNALLTDAGEEAYAKQVGISYNADENILTPNGQATLLTKLYKRELLNEEHTKLLLSYMQKTNEESLIPGALPSKYTFYHKYGELEDNVHDTAIINDGSRTYVLAVYTNGKGYYAYDKRTKTIHDIVNTVIQALKH